MGQKFHLHQSWQNATVERFPNRKVYTSVCANVVSIVDSFDYSKIITNKYGIYNLTYRFNLGVEMIYEFSWYIYWPTQQVLSSSSKINGLGIKVEFTCWKACILRNNIYIWGDPNHGTYLELTCRLEMMRRPWSHSLRFCSNYLRLQSILTQLVKCGWHFVWCNNIAAWTGSGSNINYEGTAFWVKVWFGIQYLWISGIHFVTHYGYKRAT